MASIQEIGSKIKNWADVAIGDWGLIAIIFLLSLASFGLGRLSVLESVKPPVSITNAPTIAEPRGMNIGGLIVASRTGSAYYFPWCASAAKIAPQNQVWFANEEKARSAGYAPAKNCRGLVQ